MRQGEYYIARHGRWYRIMYAEDDRHGKPTGDEFPDYEEARRRRYQLNGWNTRRN